MTRLAGWRDYSKAEIKHDNSNAWRFVLSGCLVKHFNISGSEVIASSSRIKSARITRWRIPWGEMVSVATVGARILVSRSVVWYVDVVSATKCWSVSRTSIYSIYLPSWRDLKLNRREAIDVVQGVEKWFTGWSPSTKTRARPRQVSVSTKYVTADLDYSNSGTLSITVAVEGGCCPAICLCAPTPHKPATGWTPEDWS